MFSKVAPSLNHPSQTFSEVLTLIQRKERQLLVMPAFVKIAICILKEVYAQHTHQTGGFLSLDEINMTYDAENDLYLNIRLNKKTPHEHHANLTNASQEKRNDVYGVTAIIENLACITRNDHPTKTRQLAHYIIQNELQALRVGCDHYRDKTVAESLSILLNALIAVKKLITSPVASNQNALVMKDVRKSGLIPKVLGHVIQQHSSAQDFSEILINFLIHETTTRSSLSQSLLRGTKSNRIIDLNQASTEFLETNNDSMSKSAYRNNAIIEQDDEEMLAIEKLTETADEKSFTPCTSVAFSSPTIYPSAENLLGAPRSVKYELQERSSNISQSEDCAKYQAKCTSQKPAPVNLLGARSSIQFCFFSLTPTMNRRKTRLEYFFSNNKIAPDSTDKNRKGGDSRKVTPL